MITCAIVRRGDVGQIVVGHSICGSARAVGRLRSSLVGANHGPGVSRSLQPPRTPEASIRTAHELTPQSHDKLFQVVPLRDWATTSPVLVRSTTNANAVE